MAKLKIAQSGATVFVESAHSIEELLKVRQCLPERLIAYDTAEEGYRDEMFRIDINIKSPNGSISPYGFSFGSNNTATGKATIKIEMKDATNVDEAFNEFNEKYGASMRWFREIDDDLNNALNQIEQDYQNTRTLVEVIEGI